MFGNEGPMGRDYWNCVAVPIKKGRCDKHLDQYSPLSFLAYQKIFSEVSESMDLLHEDKYKHGQQQSDLSTGHNF